MERFKMSSKKKKNKKLKVVSGEVIVPESQQELVDAVLEETVEETSLLQKVNFSLQEGLDFLDSDKTEAPDEQKIELYGEEAGLVEEVSATEDREADPEDQASMASDETSGEEPAVKSEALDELFIEDTQLISILESVLFVSDKPVSMSQFKGVFASTNIGLKEIKKGLEKLQSNYADSNRGVTLEEITGGWQLRTKADNVTFLRRSIKTRPFKLGGATLEVLSIIAYKQPIVKSEVDEIRGVESGHLIRALMERGLVGFDGKSELPGKPMQYATTRKFLEIFGLRNIKELPSLQEIDQLIPEGIGEEEEKEQLSDITDQMSESLNASYSEGEEELEKITEKLGTIDTSSAFFEEEKRRQRAKKDKERAEDIRDALLMGEDVSTRDKNWLEKYEAGAFEEPAKPVIVAQTDVALAEDIDLIVESFDDDNSSEGLSEV